MLVFAQRMKKERERKGWSKVYLGSVLGISGPAIGNYESGRRFPDGQMLVKIAEVFACSVDYLLGYSDTRQPEKPHISIAEPEIKQLLQQITQTINEAEKAGLINEKEKIRICEQAWKQIEFELYKLTSREGSIQQDND